MIPVAAGDLVIITHPVFDRHVVAEVVSATKATCKVHYYSPMRGKSEEIKQRKLEAIVAKLPEGRDPQAIAIVMNNLASIRDEIIKRANQQYARNVASYGEIN